VAVLKSIVARAPEPVSKETLSNITQALLKANVPSLNASGFGRKARN
jgi:hypothetical protein